MKTLTQEELNKREANMLHLAKLSDAANHIALFLSEDQENIEFDDIISLLHGLVEKKLREL